VRGSVVRQVMTMRGGDRPKKCPFGILERERNATLDVGAMVGYATSIDGRVQDNLRRWKTGGFRRPSDESLLGT